MSPTKSMLALCWLALWMLSSSALAQSQPQVDARLTTGVVKLGGDVGLIVEVSGAQNATLSSLPSVDGLRFGSPRGPSLEESYMITGGKQTRSRKLTWVVPIQPMAKGEYAIPSFPVKVDGRDLATRPVELRVVEDMQGDKLGVFEIDAPKQVVEGQPFTITLRFGWDAGIDGGVNYANLSLPWLGAIPGLVELDTPTLAQAPSIVELSLNKNDRIRAERLPETEIDGHKFQLLQVRKRYTPSRPGKLEFTTSHFEFGQMGEQNVFSVRRSEPHTYFKPHPAFDIEVQRLPEQGRPLDYTGAVGTLRASATADRRDVDAGDSIKLAVTWAGEGNLEFFDPPDPSRMDAFKNFRVYGTSDRKTAERRTVTYDLAPISAEVNAIPALPLAVYDPAKSAYTVVATEPIPIRVRALANATPLAATPRASATALDIRDIQTDIDDVGEPPQPGVPAVAITVSTVVVAWLGLRAIVRRRGDPDAPRARARRAARKRLAVELASATTASQEARALQRFLAARTGESEQAWVGRDVMTWMRDRAQSLSPDDAHELAQLVAELDRRTYAGRDERLGAAQIEGLSDRLVKGGFA